MRIYVTKREIDIISKIISESEIDYLYLDYNSDSGIGYTLDIEYDTYINDRKAIVRIPITNDEDW
jgi:hypothetical protein